MVTGDGSSHSQGQSGKRLLLASRGHPIRSGVYHGSSIDPTHQAHTLDPTPEVPFPRLLAAIRLLIKDENARRTAPFCFRDLKNKQMFGILEPSLTRRLTFGFSIMDSLMIRPVSKGSPESQFFENECG